MGNVNTDEKIKAWITKYALSEGIHVVDGEVCHNIRSTMLKYGNHSYAHGKDWHRTQEKAIKRAEDMRQMKIASIRRQLSKLENMTFAIRGEE